MSSRRGELPRPPIVQMKPLKQLLRFNQRQIQFVFGARRRLGDVFALRTPEPLPLVITSLPDDVRSLFTAKPEEAPSLAASRRCGRSSGRTRCSPRSASATCASASCCCRRSTARRSSATWRRSPRRPSARSTRWPLGSPFALAPHMQAITLDVIMAGIFGIEGQPARGTPEGRLRATIKSLVALSTKPVAQLAELMNVGREEPIGLHPRRRCADRPPHGRGDRPAQAGRGPRASAATSSRCCCRPEPRTARR